MYVYFSMDIHMKLKLALLATISPPSCWPRHVSVMWTTTSGASCTWQQRETSPPSSVCCWRMGQTLTLWTRGETMVGMGGWEGWVGECEE